jgi:DNA-binding response OmpR family regulator
LANILLADDDVPLATVVSRWLKKEGHTVTLVDNGKDAQRYLEYSAFDLLILDWTMPEMSGDELLRAYRSAGGTVPVIMLTGKREIEDKMQGFESGADDYLTKPFDGRELVMRVKALLKRPTALSGNKLTFEYLELDTGARSVSVQGKTVPLTVREFGLLEFLVRRARQFVPSETILNTVWKDEENAGSEALSTCVRRLRQKIDIEGQRSLVRNSHGIGYGIFSLSD